MDKIPIILITLALLAFQISWANAQANEAPGAYQLKDLVIDAALNLTTYSYAVNSETNASYFNSSSLGNVTVISKSEGAVDMQNEAARSSMFLETIPDEGASKVDLLEIYFINGSDYTNWNGNWSRNAVSNITEGMKVNNEIMQQVNLINLSDMEIVGTQDLDGNEAYVLRGSPHAQLYEAYLSLALVSAYASSPISLPGEILRASRNINETKLADNGQMVTTIWIDKETHLLKKNVIVTKVLATPEILNLSGSEDFMITAETTETSTFTDFGVPVMIALPDGAGVTNPIFSGQINSTGCIACQKM